MVANSTLPVCSGPPESARPSGAGNLRGEAETIELAKKARQPSLSEPVATTSFEREACGLASSHTDRVTPTSEFVSMGRRFVEVERSLAARHSCCGATGVSTRHARLHRREGVQVNQHKPLSRTFKRLSIRHQNRMVQCSSHPAGDFA